MAAGWPALAVVLFALAAPLIPTPGGGARADDDASHHHISWCLKKECKCTGSTGPADDNDNDRQQQVSVKCTYSGEKPVTLELDKNSQSKWLVAVELCGDGRGNLTVSGRTFAQCTSLRSFNVSGFAELTVQRHGLLVKNVDSGRLAITIGRVGHVTLDTNALQLTAGTADVLIEDCDAVQLNSEVITRLQSFVLRRIGNLTLSENTFMNAAAGLTIKKIVLEELTAEKLPSNAFKTSIDHLSITNCTFNTIEENAFPINTVTDFNLTNVTINRVKSKAFRYSLLITNLEIIGCHVQEMEENAINSSVQRVHIERSKFGTVQTSAVVVANELVMYNNTFELVASHGFVLNNLHSVRVDGNTFGTLAAEAFFESSAVMRLEPRSELQMHDNVFLKPANGSWSPVVRLQWAANDTNVTGNRFNVSCGCDPWRFVIVADNGTAGFENDEKFAELNYCKANATKARCANLTTVSTDFRIAEFQTAAGCDGDTAAYDKCIKSLTIAAVAETGILSIWPNFTPAIERGIITTVVLLILCGFGIVCAVSAVTWLNARGYFIKLRSLLTTDSANGDDGSHGMSRTISAHSLTVMSVHDYAELQRHKLGGSDDVGDRVVLYQDKGTQTVPEELTHEMLQELRVKLDDPEDYAEARGMIEHLYDLIRVEETCCSGSGWYSSGSLDDMTSTITTKAVTVGSRAGPKQDLKSVGTNTPSLDKLWPPKMYMSGAAAATNRRQRPQLQQRPQDRSRRPPSVVEYMDPADLIYGSGSRDKDADADIYSELTDLRGVAEDRPLPPVPTKPATQV